MTQDIDVCVCTFRRPAMLHELLQSLRVQDCPDFSFRIIVVDNDKDASAKAVVEAFGGPMQVTYHVEPESGLAHARNAALALTSAPFVAFIDDDEIAPPGWLKTLRGAMIEHDADAVVGGVQSRFDEGAPAWARRHPLFNLPSYPTGTQVGSAATGNVMLSREGFGGEFPRFNLEFGLSGGEDTDFFHRAHRSGRRLIYCREAFVVETVAPERTEVAWITQRAYRTGRGFAKILVSKWSLPKRAAWYGWKLVQLSAALPLLPVLRLLSFNRYVLLKSRVWAAAGHLSVAVGYRTDSAEYAHLHRN